MYAIRELLRGQGSIATEIPTKLVWIPVVIIGAGLSLSSLAFPYYAVQLILAVLLLIIFVTVAGNKEFGLFAIIITLFLTSTCSLHFNATWSVPGDGIDLLIFLSFFTYVSWLLSRVLVKERDLSEKNLIIIISFLLVVWTTLTLLWAPNLPHGLIQWIKIVSSFLILFLSSRILNSHRLLHTAIWTFIIMGLVDSFLVYISVFFVEDKVYYAQEVWGNLDLRLSYGPRYDRGVGFSGPNPTAARLNFIIFLTIGKVLVTRNTRIRNFLYISIPFMLLAHLLTMSRGALVAFVCGISFFLFFSPYLKEKFFRNITITFIAITFFYIFIFSSGILQPKLGYKRVTDIASPATTGVSSLGQRFEFWSAGLTLYEDTNGLGLGAGGYQHYMKPVPYAHNLYLSALFDLGMVGFLLLLIIIALVVKTCFSIVAKMRDPHAKVTTLSIIAGILALLIHGLIDFTFILPELWFLIGMMIASGKLNKYDDHMHRRKSYK